MNYKDCLDYLFSQLPMYQRIGKAAYKADLNNTISLMKVIGNPEQGLTCVHIAGTNGKGSVSHMLASVFQESGYKIGLYTSPHLKDFRERIKIDGKKISKKSVVKFVKKYKEETESINPSFFEWTMALAFDHFRRENVDIAVIETGMGGRLDSTNVVNPELSIITNIGFDHTQFLGNTLALIAIEKAGIIKMNVPVVIGEVVEETKVVFDDKALLMKSSIHYAEDKLLNAYECDLKGPYQKKNQQTVLHSLNILQDKFPKISEDSIKKGLSKVIKNTDLHGRWEMISKKPDVLVDMAHNKAGIEMVLEAIEKMDFQDLHIVWGMVNDKDIEAVMEIMPKRAKYYFCRPDIPRGLDVESLHNSAQKVGLHGLKFKSVKKALKKARSNASKKDLIFVGGSTFVVAEVV